MYHYDTLIGYFRTRYTDIVVVVGGRKALNLGSHILLKVDMQTNLNCYGVWIVLHYL